MLIRGWPVSRWTGTKGRAAGFTCGDGIHCMRLQYMFIHRHALLDVVIAGGDCLFVLELRYSIFLLLRTYRRNLTLQHMIMGLVYEQTIRYYTSRKHAQYVQGSYVDK
jgi:hypothetical protein